VIAEIGQPITLLQLDRHRFPGVGCADQVSGSQPDLAPAPDRAQVFCAFVGLFLYSALGLCLPRFGTLP